MAPAATVLDRPDESRLAIGGNSPPEPIPPGFLEDLAARHREDLAAVDAIADRANSLPKQIRNEVDLGRLGDVVKDARRLFKRLDIEIRMEETAPWRSLVADVNGFFKFRTDQLSKIFGALETRATDYQREVEAEKRRAAEDEARKLREREDAARAKAQAAHEEGRAGAVSRHEDTADLAAERAARLEKQASASAADLTRTRSAGGTVSTTRTTWAFEITDLSKVPLEMLRPYLTRADIDKAIRSFVKNNQDAVQLSGVRIYQDTKAAFR